MSRVLMPFAWAGDVIQCTVATAANGNNGHSCDCRIRLDRVTRVRHAITHTLARCHRHQNALRQLSSQWPGGLLYRQIMKRNLFISR